MSSPMPPRVDVIYEDETGQLVHLYWSTWCRHGKHGRCEATELAPGVPRSPAQCKDCGAGCRCWCHGVRAVTR